jgi:hypothetical protein
MSPTIVDGETYVYSIVYIAAYAVMDGYESPSDVLFAYLELLKSAGFKLYDTTSTDNGLLIMYYDSSLNVVGILYSEETGIFISPLN